MKDPAILIFIEIMIRMKEARFEKARSYSLNKAMWIESDLIEAEIEELKKMKEL